MSTTVDAASYDLPYIISINGNIFVSDGIFILKCDTSGATTVSANLDDLRAVNCTTVLRLSYNVALSQWQTEYIYSVNSASSPFYRYGTSTIYSNQTKYAIVKPGTSREPVEYWQAVNVVTNVDWNSYEKSAVGSYSNDLTQLPQGLTESAVRDIINQQLNTQTASGSTAQTIINNTTQNYNLYLQGNINITEMQQIVTQNLDTLNGLNPSTLLDAMEINNAITYNQTIQDQLYNTTSDTTLSLINDYLALTHADVYEYQQGNSKQEYVVNRIRTRIRTLESYIVDGTINTTADIAAVQTAISTMQASLDTVTGYKDLEPDVADKSQASDQEELDYLDDLSADVTSTIEQLAPSKNFTGTQTGEAQEVMDLIWENEFVKRLLPMCAGFMVVCVVLGIRYKV